MTTLTAVIHGLRQLTDRNKDEEQDNSIDENSVTTNNINSSGLSLPELFSKVEKSV